jgi:tripartite-type tricarboxylate transporter receptor subunit TctC
MISSATRVAALALAVFAAAPAQAQPYPSRPVTIMLPLAAGTGMDSLVRLYGEKLSQRLGKPIVVDNRPGAGLTLATGAAAASPPDGYTLLVATSGPMAIAPVTYKSLTYDARRDFVPIAFYVRSPFILIANPDLPFKTVAEFIKHAKENPTPLTYTSVGPGSPQHLTMEYVKARFSLPMTHVPYRNSGQAVTDTAAGHVQVGWAEAGASLPVIRDGKVRALAVSATTRLPLLPDVPTFAEASGAADFEAVSWHMLFAPAKTPRDIVDRLHAEMKAIMADPEMEKRAAAIGLIPQKTPSIEEIQAYIRAEQDKWGALVKAAGLEGTQ